MTRNVWVVSEVVVLADALSPVVVDVVDVRGRVVVEDVGETLETVVSVDVVARTWHAAAFLKACSRARCDALKPFRCFGDLCAR